MAATTASFRGTNKKANDGRASTHDRSQEFSVSGRRLGGNRQWNKKLWVVCAFALAYPSLKLVHRLLPDSSGRGLAFSEEFLASTRPIQFGGQFVDDREADKYPQWKQKSNIFPLKSRPNPLKIDSSGCLTSDCIQTIGRSFARAYPDRTNHTEWCLPENARNPNKEGLMLVKVPKAASSTSAGVALRIADRHNCKALQWQHKPGKTYAKRNPQNSFLLTSIRDPASRVLSYLFFMEVSIDGVEYSEEWILNRLKHFSGRYGSIADGQGGFTMQFAALEKIPQFSAWSPENRTQVVDPEATHARVQQIVDGYDFMLVVDRMDESLVALSLLLGINVGDVLVTSSKVAGSFFYDPPRHQCVSLSKSFASPAVKEYLESDDWKAQNYGDYLLHAAANRSLDLTIDRLGQERFQNALQLYKKLQALEKRLCAPQVQFPCSNDGKPQPKRARKECYQRDFGCGYKCIDDIIAKEGSGLSAKPSTNSRAETAFELSSLA